MSIKRITRFWPSTALIFVFSSALRSIAGVCPPAGDGNQCTTPLLAGEGTFIGTTLDNTASAGNVSSCSPAGNPDEWYCYAATCTGLVRATTCNATTDFDTTLAVFDSCGGIELGCNDDAQDGTPQCSLGGFSLKSSVIWPATASNTYFIKVAGYSGAIGNYALELACLQACCFDGLNCADLPPTECAAQGGLALGSGTNCSVTQCPQACCFDNGVCQDLSESDCLSNGGEPLGEGTSCSTDNCLQACCLAPGDCTDATVNGCVAFGGAGQGFGTSCLDSECPQACCFPNGSCQDLTPSACAAAGGLSQCRGVDCAGGTCECPCPGDVDDDGELDLMDVSGLVNCLFVGQCDDSGLNCACVDMNLDGRADGADIQWFVDASLAQAQCGPGNILASQTLVVYNSAFADATVLKNAYLNAHPAIPPENVLNLNDPTLTPGDLSYADFVSKVRNPIRNYLLQANPPAPDDLIVIVLIRPFPHRIQDTDNAGVGDTGASVNEFLPPANGGQGDATYASVDAELVLLWQNLESGEIGGTMDSRSDNLVDNPYHMTSARIAEFPRVNIQTQKTFINNANVAWSLGGAGATQLTPGDMYLVCRMDAISLAGALDLVERSQSAYVNKALGRIILDEFNVNTGQDLDDDSLFGPSDFFNAGDDYEETRNLLLAAGWDVRYDGSFDFVDGTEETAPIIGYASYGENHVVNGLGESPPPPAGTYIEDFKFPIGAIFNTIESFNARGINGLSDFGQEQVVDFVASGGTFAVGHVWEPFSFTVPDNEYLLTNMLAEPAVNRLQFAEAAYTCIPALSWQHVVVGDPLAKLAVINDAALPKGDLNGDGQVNGRDIPHFTQIMLEGIAAHRFAFPALDPIARSDFNGDCMADFADTPGFVAALLGP